MTGRSWPPTRSMPRSSPHGAPTAISGPAAIPPSAGSYDASSLSGSQDLHGGSNHPAQRDCRSPAHIGREFFALDIQAMNHRHDHAQQYEQEWVKILLTKHELDYEKGRHR